MKKIIFALLMCLSFLAHGQTMKFGGSSIASARANLKGNSSLYTMTYIGGILYLVSSTTEYTMGFTPSASPTFTGTVTMPTPFTLGATSVTTTGTKLNYLTSAGGTTGTTSANLVFSTSPTLTNPVITNIAPAANFTLTQNSVVPFTSVNSGAVENTLYLNAGKVGVGTTAIIRRFDIKNTLGSSLSLTLSNNDYVFGTTGTALAFGTGATSGNTYYKMQVYNSGESSAGVLSLNSDGGNVGIGTTSPTSKLQVTGLPTYADNTAALAGGLTAGAFYRTSTGVLMVAY